MSILLIFKLPKTIFLNSVVGKWQTNKQRIYYLTSRAINIPRERTSTKSCPPKRQTDPQLQLVSLDFEIFRLLRPKLLFYCLQFSAINVSLIILREFRFLDS